MKFILFLLSFKLPKCKQAEFKDTSRRLRDGKNFIL